jgi:hypothetical protein
MGCDTSRVSVSPLLESVNNPSAAMLSQRQRPNRSREAWSETRAGEHESVEEPHVLATAMNFNVETENSSLPTGTSPTGTQKDSVLAIDDTNSKCYSATSNSHDDSETIFSPPTVSNVRLVEASDTNRLSMKERQSDELTLVDRRDTQNSLYQRVTQLRARVDASTDVNENKENNEMSEFGVGRSRSIQSLRCYHKTHSDQESVVPISKRIVKGLITKTLSNFDIADATSLDWDVLAQSVERSVMAQQMKESVDRESTPMLHDSMTHQPEVTSSSPDGSMVKETSVPSNQQEWTIGPQNPSKTANPVTSPVSFGLTVEPHRPLETYVLDKNVSHMAQSEQTDTLVSWLSPTVSRRASSISEVSSILSLSVMSNGGLEELVELVSTALMSKEDGTQPSKMQMLVLQPSLVTRSLSSEDKVFPDIGLDKVKRAELQTAEIGQSEELLSVHELYNLLNAGISKIHIL